MASPWHISLKSAPNLRPKAQPPKPSLLKHLSSVPIHEKPRGELMTGLMFDIGINNMEPSAIRKLIATGASIARLNVSDFEPATCSVLIQSIRQAVLHYSQELEYVYSLAIIVEVRGPHIITGSLKGGPQATLEIIQTANLRLTTDTDWRECGTADCLFVGWSNLIDLKKGDVVYINTLPGGKVKLIVEEVGGDSIDCHVDTGGIIGCKMAVLVYQAPRDTQRLSGSFDSINCITGCVNIPEQQSFELVEAQVAFAVASDADALIIPRTQNKFDILYIREILADNSKHILVFACIDTVFALDNIDDILTEADGIYFDRCILSTDLPVERIFIAQKVIIAKCNSVGKPCICKAVLNEEVVSLCVTDVANMVLDGADVLALEIEYDSPLKKLCSSGDALRSAENCLAAMNVICRQAERIKWPMPTYGDLELMGSDFEETSKAICATCINLARRSKAAVIICLTTTGGIAKLLSYSGSPCHVLAVTRACHVARQLRFWRGVNAMHYIEEEKKPWSVEVDSCVQAALDYCKAKRIVHSGDPYVILNPSRRDSENCNSIRLLYASDKDIFIVK